MPGTSIQSLIERCNAWLLSYVGKGTPADRWRALRIVLMLLTIIGLTDYLVGVRVSMVLFYALPVTLSVAAMGWGAGCLTGLASVIIRVAGDLAAGGYTAKAGTIFWNRLLDVAMYCVLAGIFHAFITLQRQLEQRVQERTAKLAEVLQEREELQRQLFNLSRNERTSIGHELHDSLGQHLTATSLAAKLLANRLEADRHTAAPEARTLVRLIQDAIGQTRQIARGLLLSSVVPDELLAQLEEFCVSMQRDHRVTCRFLREGKLGPLDSAQSSHLYYIAQEAARNALRHAAPTLIEVRLRTTPQGLELSVTDNGQGLPATRPAGAGMGLRIMAHRAQLIGARFGLDSSPGKGLRVSCHLPLPPAVV